MEETIKPASDEEIAGFEWDCVLVPQASGRYCNSCGLWARNDEPIAHKPTCDSHLIPRIKVRISSDRAKIAVLETTQEELVKALEKAKTYIHAPWRPDDVVTVMLGEVDAALAKARAAQKETK